MIAQLHLYLDDIDPRGIGKPIFGGAGAAHKSLCEELIMRRSSLSRNRSRCCSCSPPGEASAHAILDHAEPRVGNKVATAPHELTLWFTQKLEPAFSTVTVTDAAGKRVDTGKARVDGSQMSVSLRSGGTGPIT